MARFHRLERNDGTIVEIAITERSDGDFHIDSPDVESRRDRVVAGPWTVVRQVHGRRVVDAVAGRAEEADGLITDEIGHPIAVQGADCAPVALVGASGPIAVAHVGWRGLEAGVLDEAIDRLEAAGAIVSAAVVGPHIGPGCYEFGAEDLDRIADRFGPTVRGTTKEGTAALALGAGIAAALEERGVADVRLDAPCTGCEGGGWSHRSRRETERHALVARIVGDRA